MSDELLEQFMRSIVAVMTEEEKDFVEEKLEVGGKPVEIAFETTYMHWLFMRDSKRAKELLLELLRGEHD